MTAELLHATCCSPRPLILFLSAGWLARHPFPASVIRSRSGVAVSRSRIYSRGAIFFRYAPSCNFQQRIFNWKSAKRKESKGEMIARGVFRSMDLGLTPRIVDTATRPRLTERTINSHRVAGAAGMRIEIRGGAIIFPKLWFYALPRGGKSDTHDCQWKFNINIYVHGNNYRFFRDPDNDLEKIMSNRSFFSSFLFISIRVKIWRR